MIAELLESPKEVPRLIVHYSDGSKDLIEAMLRFQFRDSGPLAYDTLDRLLYEFSQVQAVRRQTCDPERKSVVRIESEMVAVKTDPLVWVRPETLRTKGLDYAVAVALDWKEPYYGIGGIRVDEGRPGEASFLSYDAPDPDEEELEFNHTYGFSPSVNVGMAAHIAISHGISVEFVRQRDAGDALAAKAWIGDYDRNGAVDMKYPLAVCRALVNHKLSDGVAIPLSFIRADDAQQ
jgi:hypothetical protein